MFKQIFHKKPVIPRLSWWLVAAAMVIYTWLATNNLDRPGLHFDELLHVNAALGGLDNTFIYKEILGVPVLLMPYIGALKAYITAPIFALFGVSVATIRLPMILITAATLPLLFVAVRRLFDTRTAVVAMWLFALNPTIISLTRLDSGPVVLALVATTASLFFLERLITRGTIWSAIGLVASLAAGVFHKLNFIWFVNGMFGAAIFVYGKYFWRQMRDNQVRDRQSGSASQNHKAVILAALGILALIGLYLVISIKFNLLGYVGGDQYSWSLRLSRVASNLTSLLNGEMYINYSLTDFHSYAGTIYSALAIALIATAVLLHLRRTKRTKNRRAFWFVALALVLIVAQIIITRNAVWPWHFSAVEPLVTILLSASLVTVIGEVLRWTRQRTRTLALAILTIVAVMYHLWLFGQYLEAFDRPPRNIYWSTAIYELIDYTAASEKKIVSIDWGTHTQLLSFSKDPDKFKNESFNLNRSPLPSPARQQFTENYLREPEQYLFVLHPSRFTLFKSARKNFFELAADAGLNARLVDTIDDSPRVIFEIYHLERTQ